MMNIQNEAVDDTLLVATFLLGEAAFGVDALQVEEVTRVCDLTPVHHAPPDVVGIRNLRGRIVTVIDLRSRLGLGTVATGRDNRILIVDGQGEPIGLLVDSVADTLETRPDLLAPPPPHLHGVKRCKLRGVCRGGGRLVALLDLAPVLQPEEQPHPLVPAELAPA
jgi:purine-binding chemotaxis protein CheW